MTITRFTVLAAIALSLGGCSWMPDMSWMNPWSSSSPTTSAPAQPQAMAPAPAPAPAPRQTASAPSPTGPVGEPAHSITDTQLGKVLASNRGMTLYTYALDTAPGMSMCTESCSSLWPPLLALDDAVPVGHWSIVPRPDGMKQWAYGGWPLYGSRDDLRPGDTRGEGRGNGAWKVARP